MALYLFIIQKYNQPQYPGVLRRVLRRAYCVLRVLRTADLRHNTDVSTSDSTYAAFERDYFFCGTAVYLDFSQYVVQLVNVSMTVRLLSQQLLRAPSVFVPLCSVLACLCNSLCGYGNDVHCSLNALKGKYMLYNGNRLC